MTRTRVRRRRAVAALVAAVLLLPVAAKAASGTDGPVFERRVESYTVRPGDTLWSIAQARGESDPRALVDAISQENADASVLVPGQILRIPLP